MESPLKPTDAQKVLYQYILGHVESFGFQPSRTEMAHHFGVSTAAIKERLDGLEKKGFIISSGVDRGIIFPKVGFSRLVLTDEEAVETARRLEEQLSIPVVNRLMPFIKAGIEGKAK